MSAKTGPYDQAQAIRVAILKSKVKRLITQDDIDTFADDVAIADRVMERVQRGVPHGREMHAEEVMPLLRALWLWKTAAIGASEFIRAAQKRAIE